MLIWLSIIAVIIYLDQLTKWLIITYLPDGGLPIIEGVLRFTYVENTGAAFGMLSDHRWVFIIISAITLLGMLWYLIKKKPGNKLLKISLVLIIGGGIGNMIDRVLLGYVIDFIDFCAFPNFWVWVFNIADAAICIGTGLLTLYLIISTLEEAKALKVAKIAASASEANADVINKTNEKTDDKVKEDENDKTDRST